MTSPIRPSLLYNVGYSLVFAFLLILLIPVKRSFFYCRNLGFLLFCSFKLQNLKRNWKPQVDFFCWIMQQIIFRLTEHKLGSLIEHFWPRWRFRSALWSWLTHSRLKILALPAASWAWCNPSSPQWWEPAPSSASTCTPTLPTPFHPTYHLTYHWAREAPCLRTCLKAAGWPWTR